MWKNKKFTIGGLGEVLWDIFSDTKKLGGAPANFAAHVRQLGAKSCLLSAVGKDLLGQEAITQLQQSRVDTSGVQVKENYATGSVNVRLDPMGKPTYIIRENVAWDNIEFDANQKKIAQALDAICFGTLAQRNPISRNSIFNTLKSTNKNCLKVFDVNFRQDFYNPKIVEQSLNLANVIKMNGHEFLAIANMLDISKNHKNGLQSIIRNFNLKFGIITLGEKGAVIANKYNYSYYQPNNTIKVKSTVGAGDAFSASAVIGWLYQKPLEQIIKEASDLASYVCSHLEAVPK